MRGKWFVGRMPDDGEDEGDLREDPLGLGGAVGLHVGQRVLGHIAAENLVQEWIDLG